MIAWLRLSDEAPIQLLVCNMEPVAHHIDLTNLFKNLFSLAFRRRIPTIQLKK